MGGSGSSRRSLGSGSGSSRSWGRLQALCRATHNEAIRRWSSVLASGALVVGTALIGVAATAAPAPAVAAQPLDCDTLYALQGQSPHAIYRVDTETGDLAVVHEMDLGSGSGNNNGMGISVDGRYVFTHREPNVYVFDTVTETTQEFDGINGLNATHGAVDPLTGVYYFGNIDGSNDFAHVYAFDPATSTLLGEVARLEMPGGGPGGNGDWAFDASGNLNFTSGSSGGRNAFYVARGPLPTNEQDDPVQIVARVISEAETGEPINGLAVHVLGYVYLSSSDNLFQVNPTSGAMVNQERLDPTDQSVDMASCATPSTIMVQKDVIDRRNPTDQFTVSVTGGDIPEDATGNTGTTTGDDTGIQDETGEFGGPLMVLAEQTFTIIEEPAGSTDLGNYTTTWQCVNETDDELVAEGAGTEGEFTVPVADPGELGAAVVCTFTNDDLPQAGLEISKSADPADEVAPGGAVSYTVTVENTGETTYTVDDPATFSDDLSGVLDDATFNDDAEASTGEVSYAEPVLSWSSADDPFGPGDVATVTYSVTVNDPPSGDGVLDNAVVGPPESNCDTGTEDECHVPVPVRSLEITKSAEPDGEVSPGGTVSYTITVVNTGRVPYTEATPATFDDDLSSVLDDAVFNDDAEASTGEVSYAEPVLSWSGALAPGETATITYSVTVNDPPSGDGVLANAVVGPPESNCDTGTEPDCSIVVPDRSLEIVKSADPSDAVSPGATLSYTITVTNTGQLPYTVVNPATFIDDLSEVLDDAVYNEDAQADIGEVSYEEPVLSWAGALGVGETATISYSVTVNDPLTGDGVLDNAVVGPPESNCDTGTEPDCHVPVPVRALEIVKSASPSDEVAPGGTVEYTITVENTGRVPYTVANPASFDDDLSSVLDDAAFNDDGEASTGEVSYAEPVLSWSGALEPGETATITYSVTVNDPPSGDGALDNAVVGPPESNCDTGTEPDCHVPLPVRSLEIVKSASPGDDVSPGGTVSYTITVQNTGQVPYTVVNPASFTDDLTAVLDDAVFNDDEQADVGEVAYEEPVLSWSGALAPGETATISYSVTVNDPMTGDGVLDNAVVGPPESNCDTGTEDDCHVPIPVRVLEIVKFADPAGSVDPGGSVGYTITVQNTGQVPYTVANPASFTDDLSSVLDDAAFNDDAEASTGEVSYGEPVLSWSGALAPGETATITYSVTVNDPPSGDGVLDNAVVGPPESNCDTGTEDDCHVPVPVRALAIVKSAEPDGEVSPGGTVSYTITVENTGRVAYTVVNPASFTDDLSSVLDDAVFNDDAEASTGEVSYAEPVLSWSGALEPGGTATITYSVTVNDPPSGDGVLANAVVGPPESNCDTGTEPDCSIVVPDRSLEITKTAAPDTEISPGGTVTYTITVQNTGQVPYTGVNPAVFADDLSGVLDDATFNDDAEASTGEVSYLDPILAWSGALGVGAIATITYSVTVNDPPGGDGVLDNAVVGPPESNCDTGTEPDCHVPVPVRSLEIMKSADPAGGVDPGGSVGYTITVTNTGQVPYTVVNPASFTDDLSSVLDDAAFNDDAEASTGDVSYAEPVLSWSGALAPGETATITYSVTVNDPPSGDGVLDNAVVGPPESNCDTGTEPDCHVPVPVRSLEIVKSASPSDEVAPGGTVSYTITVTNTGQVPYTVVNPASFTDDLSEVLDDAVFNDDADASTGEVGYEEPLLSWFGALAPGETATITYSVTVNDPPSGDGVLDNAVVGPPESNCDTGTEPDCHVPVPVRALEIVKSASPSDEVAPGGTVSYTITVTNTGQVPYSVATPANFADDLSEVLDDAVFNDDAEASIGEVSFAEPVLHWQGPLGIGETATITYSVTVIDPPSGDGVLDNAVVGPPESNCDTGTEDDCHVPVPVRALEITKWADPADALAGGAVEYTITVTNTGRVPYTVVSPAGFTDDLSGVLDDAVFNDDERADVGEVSYEEPVLSWSGALGIGETATVTYSVTVNDPLTGDGVLDNAVVGPPESNCDTGSEPSCHVPVPVRSLEIVKSASPTDEVSPGGTVSYTVTVTNDGQAPYTVLDPAVFADDLSGVLDDATFNDDAQADVGEVGYLEPLLSWSGALAPAETATITYSVTVNDPPSGDGVLDNAVVGPPESNCDTGTEPDCHVPVPVRSLEMVKSAQPVVVLPGGTVEYTITVTNTGQVPYTVANPASFTDDLSEVLDDAEFNDDVEASTGDVSYAEPVLSWSGALAPGETATVTYSVTVDDPPTGQSDGELANAVVGPDESNCDTGAEDDCHVDVPIRELLIEKTADVDEAVPGQTVTYTIEVTNVGDFPFGPVFPARFDDDLSEVLDDAMFNDDAQADVGEVSYTEPVLHWESPLDVGETATITYSVTVGDPLSGDGVLENVVVGPPASNCDPDSPGYPEDECQTIVPVRALEIAKIADPIGEVQPGDKVGYTITVTNTGQVSYTSGDPASITDDMSDVLDDAVFDDDAQATTGEVDYAEPVLSWTGALAPGETATVTYTVTVNDPPTGDGTLVNAVVGPPESNCDTGTEDDCGTVVPPGDLPPTGNSLGPGVLILGLLLLAGGGALIRTGRR